MEQQIREFVNVVRARNIRESLAAVLLVVYFGYRLTVNPETVYSIGAGVVIIACFGILAIAWGVLNISESEVTARPPDQHPEHWRKLITTQAKGLRLAWLWYVLPLFLGVALMVTGRGEGLTSAPTIISLAVLAVVGALLAAANFSAGAKLERFRDELFGKATA